MADILKVYTAEQLYDMFRLKILADACGLTDFNVGSKTRALLEANSEAISTISIDHKEALYQAIPVALYQGFGFPKKTATKAAGYIRPYRKPLFTIDYTGAGSDALITTTATGISATSTGAPGDAFSFLYSTYPKTSDVVAAIEALTNWTATLITDTDSVNIYQYSAVDCVGSTTYLNVSGLDIMVDTATEKIISTGYTVSVDGIQISTILDGIIESGTSGILCQCEATLAGSSGNISVNAIDTINGKGFIVTNDPQIDGVINDSALSGGEDEETDSDRKTRFALAVNSLDAGTANGIISAILAISGVRSVGIRSAYPYKGANTIIVDTIGGSISSTLMAEIEQVLYGNPDDLENYPGKNAEGIDYIIISPTIIPINVGITIYRLPTLNISLDEIKLDVQTAIEQYINTRKLGEDVLLSEIIRVSKNSNSAAYDAVITSPGANISIGKDEFAKTGAGTAGTVTVTMVIASNI